MSCDGPLSYLAEITANSNDDGWRDKAGAILQPLLDRAVARPHQSNMVVRRALRLLPARYRDHALAWIKREPTQSETHFLFVAWLQSGLPLEEISAEIKYWCANGGETDLKASFVFKAWFDAAAKLDKTECAEKIAKVETHVLAWLGIHGKSEVARFVFEPWLDAAAKLDKIECAEKIAKVETHVLAWLGTYGNSEHARFVFKAWLDAGGSPDLIRDVMIWWLEAYPQHQDSDFITKAWLEATRDYATVRIAALSWLKHNINNPDAVYLLKFIVRDRNIPLDAIEDAICWCNNFPGEFDSICRIFPLLSRHAKGHLERPLIDAALQTLTRVKMEWLSDTGVRHATLGTIGILAWKCRFFADIEPKIDSIHANILRHSSAFSKIYALKSPAFVLNPSLADHVAGMLMREVIDPELDRDALEQFVGWLAAWPDDRKLLLRPALQALELSCPNPALWDSVGVAVSKDD